jgi:hypothetical protein
VREVRRVDVLPSLELHEDSARGEGNYGGGTFLSIRGGSDDGGLDDHWGLWGCGHHDGAGPFGLLRRCGWDLRGGDYGDGRLLDGGVHGGGVFTALEHAHAIGVVPESAALGDVETKVPDIKGSGLEGRGCG